MIELVRVFVPRLFAALVLCLGIAGACTFAAADTPAAAFAADVFVTPREALLREKPSPEARVLARLPQGARLSLLETRERYLRVEAPGLPAGWIARELTLVFSGDPSSTRELVVIGGRFRENATHRLLAACLLDRAARRLRDAREPDPEVEVLLGETLEQLAASGGPWRKELGLTEIAGPEGSRGVADGAAFVRALELLGPESNDGRRRLRERARAGDLRAKYRDRPSSLAGLLQEYNAWIPLLETAEDPAVVRAAAERVGASSLSIGRYLLALGKLDELAQLEKRLRVASARVEALSPGLPDGRRAASRAAILLAMRGDGSASFPQQARTGSGSRERAVAIEGKAGALQLTVETVAGSSRDTAVRRAAIPILPVPGSLRISPDGRFVAWVEVAGPSRLVPVMTALDRDEPAREIAFLSSGRPLRDQNLAHVVAALSGFSHDGQRLGLSIEAWNSTPGPAPRYSVVSVATGELLFETSSDLKSFQRLLQ